MDLSDPLDGLPDSEIAEAPIDAGRRRLQLVIGLAAALVITIVAALIHRVRAPRAAAVRALVETSLQVERYFERCGVYPRDLQALAGWSAAGLCAYGGVGEAGTGVVAADDRYLLRLRSPRDGAGPDSWLLTAEPIGRQAADRCGTFELDELGRYGNHGASLGAASCWRH